MESALDQETVRLSASDMQLTGSGVIIDIDQLRDESLKRFEALNHLTENVNGHMLGWLSVMLAESATSVDLADRIALADGEIQANYDMAPRERIQRKRAKQFGHGIIRDSITTLRS